MTNAKFTAAIEQAEHFADILSNELGITTRFYESIDDFTVKPVEDGLYTYSVIGYDVEQPIFIFESGRMPKIVRKFFPYDWDEEEIAENCYDSAFIGFHIYPDGYGTFKLVPFVDYRHFDYAAYAEHEPFYWTLEEFIENKAQYTEILENAIAEL